MASLLNHPSQRCRGSYGAENVVIVGNLLLEPISGNFKIDFSLNIEMTWGAIAYFFPFVAPSWPTATQAPDRLTEATHKKSRSRTAPAFFMGIRRSLLGT